MLRIALLALAACSSPPAATTTAPPSPPGAPAPPAQSAPGIGETCRADGGCADGLECVRYFGIAGASGPEFATCEKRCTGNADCPTGRSCVTVADGPGQVCR